MKRFRSVLVPLDGSPSSLGALRLAISLVGAEGAIVVAHAIDRAMVVAECVTPYGGTPEPALAALGADERLIFEQAGKILEAAGVAYSTHALDGHVVASILSLSAERDVDAIAMGTHGRSGLSRLLLGSSAAGVIRAAQVPVFVVPERAAQQAGRPLKTIVAAVDASEAAGAPAKFAVDIASATYAGSVVFAHVGETNGGADDGCPAAAAYAAAAGVPYDKVTLSGPPAVAITAAATVRHADALAVGAHGTRAKPLGLGSVAAAIAQTSSVPVIVVPAAAAPAADEHRAADADGDCDGDDQQLRFADQPALNVRS